jgi:hypothetical protein
MSTITLTQEQYEALAALAREGTANAPDRTRALDAFLRLIDSGNGITRHVLWVQWQETDTPLPAGTHFPDSWPPELRRKIERTDRAIAKYDVNALLYREAKRPITVLVSPDPAGELGWVPIEAYFRQP